MDGVIIDSEPLHVKAGIMALKNFDLEISTDYINKWKRKLQGYH